MAPSVVGVHVDGEEALNATLDVRELEEIEGRLHEPLRGVRVVLLIIRDAEDRLRVELAMAEQSAPHLLRW